MTNHLIVLKRQLAQGDTSVSSEILATESLLAALINCSLEGAKTRSQVQWIEEGEKQTRFFFKHERERIEKNNVKSIFDSNSAEVFLRAEIEDAHVNFSTSFLCTIYQPCVQGCFIEWNFQISL